MQTLHNNSTLQGGKFKIIQTLGQGGFGITYLAEQVMLGRKVAIKEFFYKECCDRDEATSHVTLGTQSNQETVQRFMNKFLKEARTISQLDHPNIIKIYDIFEENNTAYYVMEYIEGENLSEMVKRQGALPEATAVDYIKKVADALAYIHARSINHLDVKPGNIMLRKHDQQIVLIDFGLSKQYDDVGSQTSSTPVGISQGFAPIEQYRAGGVAQFSPQTDIYSLGATLYWLVIGKTPPPADEILDDGLPSMPSYVSESVKKAIESAMQVKKKDRPQSVDEFIMCLQPSDSCDEEKASPSVDAEDTIVYKENVSDTVILPQEPTKQKTRKTNSNKILAIILIGVVVLSTGVGLWIMRHQLFTDTSEEKNEILEDSEDYSIEGIAKTLSERQCKIDEPKYGWDLSFSALIAISCNGNHGFMDKYGKIVVPCKYQNVGGFHEGLAAVQKDDKWGFIDENDNMITPFEYDGVDGFSEGLAPVLKDDKWGFIDKEGKFVIPRKYQYASIFNEGFAAVWKDGKYGFIDTKGEIVIPYTYNEVRPFHEGLAAVLKDDKWGFIDKTGEIVIPCKYQNHENSSLFAFHEGLAAVQQDGKWGFIDKTGEIVIPCKYNMVRHFNEGLAAVQKDDKWGFIDKEGQWVIPCKYEWGFYFKDGSASVQQDGWMGFVDRNDNVVIPFYYDMCYNFHDGLAFVLNKGDEGSVYGLIDKKGKCTFDYYQWK